MKGILRRITVCLTLFYANPRAFLRALARPDNSQGRELRRLLRKGSK